MKNFIKSSTILMIGNLITKLLSIVYLIPLIRFNGEIGILNSYLLVPFAFIVVFGTLGMDVILTSEIVKYLDDKDKLKKIIVSSLVIIIFTGLLASLSSFFFADNLVLKSTTKNYAYNDLLIVGTKILSIGIFLYAITSYFRAILVAMGEYTVISFSYISEQVIKILLLMYGCYHFIYIGGMNVGTYVLILSYSIVISILTTLLIYIYVFIKHKYYAIFMQGKYQTDLSLYKYLFISSVVFFAAGLFTSFFDQIDIMMMAPSLHGAGVSEDVIMGLINEYFIYSLKFIMIPITTAAAFITVMIRHLYVENNKSEKVEAFDKIINVSLIYGIVSAIGLYLVGPILIRMFYGVESLGIMAFQSIVIPFYIIRNIIGSYIVTNNGSKTSIIISMVLIIVSKVIFNIILFPFFGIYGFILSSVFAILISLSVLIIMNPKMFKLNLTCLGEKVNIIIRGIICFIICAVLANLIGPHIGSSFMQLIVAMVIALIIMFGCYYKYIIGFIKN